MKNVVWIQLHSWIDKKYLSKLGFSSQVSSYVPSYTNSYVPYTTFDILVFLPNSLAFETIITWVLVFITG
jgi:hypothetical protein